MSNLKNSLFIIFIFITFLGCKNNKKVKEVKLLTEIEKKIITNFSKKLTASINKYEYNFTRNSWDNNKFRKRITKLNSTEQAIFNYYFDKQFSKNILNGNIDLINKLKFNNGKIFLSKIIFFSEHAEIIFTLRFSTNVDFWKYRVELKNNKPILTDYYFYRDECWQSQNIKNIIKLNSKYTAISKQRLQANKNLLESEKQLKNGDSLYALELLYNIPKTHLIGNTLSLKRINLAYKINDSLFFLTLLKEKKLNKSIYINYLYGYYFYDTLELNKVFNKLEMDLGVKNEIIDSLKSLNYFWN